MFFEATLIPMFIIIGVWGGPNRVYAAVKFFLYTLLGSLLTLVALIYLYNVSGGSFSLLEYHRMKIELVPQVLVFLAFFMAFAVKVPMWPVHTWLPDAHVEAPTGGSVVLAAIMLKVGGYGFIRLSLPIVPDASHVLAGFVIALSLIAVVYIGLVALVQNDMKKLIAYSSISHMGFVTLGVFIFNPLGMEGAVLQMISHGFVSGALFLCVGVLYDRMHSRQIADYGGVVNTMPVFAAFFMLFAMANSGLPGTSGFVGEFLVTLGAMQVNFWYAALAATTLIFGAAYTLWMYKRVVFGAVANQHVAELQDIGAREALVLALLAVAVLAMGMYPEPLSQVLHTSVNDLLAHVAPRANYEMTKLQAGHRSRREGPNGTSMMRCESRLACRAAGDLPARHGVAPSCRSTCSSTMPGGTGPTLSDAGDTRRLSARSHACRRGAPEPRMHSTACSCATAWPTCSKLFVYLGVAAILIYSRAYIGRASCSAASSSCSRCSRRWACW